MSMFSSRLESAQRELYDELKVALAAALERAGDDVRMIVGGRVASDVGIERVIARALRDPVVAEQVLDPAADAYRHVCRMIADAVPDRHVYDHLEHAYVERIDTLTASVGRSEGQSTINVEEAGRHIATDLETLRNRCAQKLGSYVLREAIARDAASGKLSNVTLKELELSPRKVTDHRVKDQRRSPRSKVLPLTALSASDGGEHGDDSPVAEDRLRSMGDGRDPLRILSARDDLRERMCLADAELGLTGRAKRQVEAYGRVLTRIDGIRNERKATGLRLMLELVPDPTSPNQLRLRTSPEVAGALEELGFERPAANLPNTWRSTLLRTEPELTTYLGRKVSPELVAERLMLLQRRYAERDA